MSARRRRRRAERNKTAPRRFGTREIAFAVLTLAIVAIAIAMATTRPRRSVPVSAGEITRDGAPSWSPDGSKIVFYSVREGKGQIHEMNADGSGAHRITKGNGDEGYPARSPDGSVLLFDSDDGENIEIWALDSSGTTPRNLSNHPARDVAPAWSPDGKQIAFMSDRAAGNRKHDVYIMNADGSNVRRLTREEATLFPQWSPDGKRLAFHVGRDVHVINADGSNMRRLTYDPNNGMYPSWSPDGKRIAFMSWRNGRTEIFVMQEDGSDQQKLLGPADADAIDPRWSPDGSKILFVRVRGGMGGGSAEQTIWIASADGSGATQLTGKK